MDRELLTGYESAPVERVEGDVLLLMFFDLLLWTSFDIHLDSEEQDKDELSMKLLVQTLSNKTCCTSWTPFCTGEKAYWT